ncbi:hypothetical protein ACH5RR_013356 [Cinchona calisaya]|uniref:Uncharacterized protein n=1 Tax=Cinchona calisaya TaxID=153742 RepID=A0ABD2ZZS4_9GENT
MLDNICECNGQIIDRSLIWLFIAKLGYEEELHIAYRILAAVVKHNLIRLDTKKHVFDMAAIGMIYGEVEIFLGHDFHYRFMESEVQSSTSGLRVNGHMKLTFRDCNAVTDVVYDDSKGEEFYYSNHQFRGDDEA